MKKILFIAAAVSLISSSLLAVDGKVNSVKMKSDGVAAMEIILADTSVINKPLVGTADAIKAMFAMALTAKTGGYDVTVFSGTVPEGTGWKTMILK